DDQIRVTKTRRSPGGCDKHQPARAARFFVNGKAPRRADAAVRPGDNLFEYASVKNLAADRHPFPHVMEQFPKYAASNRGAGLREQWVRLCKEAVVGREFLQTKVFDAHEPELFQVGIRVAPTTALIKPDAVSEHLPKRSFGVLQIEPAQGRFEQPFSS